MCQIKCQVEFARWSVSCRMPARVPESRSILYKNRLTGCQTKCEIKCQNTCQIECQIQVHIDCQNNICQIGCQKGCQVECQNICQIECHLVVIARRQAICFAYMFCRNVRAIWAVLCAQVLTGAPWCLSVVTANAKVECVAQVLLPLAIWLGLQPVLEQPQGSLMWEWETLKEVIAGWIMIRVTLGTFGSLSQKGLEFVGLWEGLHHLRNIHIKMALDINPKRIVESMKLTKQSGRFHGWEKSTVLCLSSLVDPKCSRLHVRNTCCGDVVLYRPTSNEFACRFFETNFFRRSVDRWQTSNEYTTISCLYPECFGMAVGFAASLQIRQKKGISVERVASLMDDFVALTVPQVPSVQEAMAIADKLLDRRVILDIISRDSSMIHKLKLRKSMSVLLAKLFKAHFETCCMLPLEPISHRSLAQETCGTRKPNFDKDPGWEGVEKLLAKRPPQAVIRGWLKDKRDAMEKREPSKKQASKKTSASKHKGKKKVQTPQTKTLKPKVNLLKIPKDAQAKTPPQRQQVGKVPAKQLPIFAFFGRPAGSFSCIRIVWGHDVTFCCA